MEGKNGWFLFAIGLRTTERPKNLILVRVLLPAFYYIRCLILLNFTREGFKTVTFSIHLNSESIILLVQRTSGNGYLIFDNEILCTRAYNIYLLTEKFRGDTTEIFSAPAPVCVLAEVFTSFMGICSTTSESESEPRCDYSYKYTC